MTKWTKWQKMAKNDWIWHEWHNCHNLNKNLEKFIFLTSRTAEWHTRGQKWQKNTLMTSRTAEWHARGKKIGKIRFFFFSEIRVKIAWDGNPKFFRPFFWAFMGLHPGCLCDGFHLHVCYWTGYTLWASRPPRRKRKHSHFGKLILVHLVSFFL